MMYKKLLNILLCKLMLYSICEAKLSPQLPDYMIYKNDTIPVYKLLLENYLKSVNETDKDSLFGLSFREGASTNCWRGYQAIYKVDGDKIYLTDVIYCGELLDARRIDKKSSDKRLKELFGEKVVNGRIPLDWFSGEISLPMRTLLRWDGVFYKIFEKETLLQVKNGWIKRIKEIDNYVDDPERLNRRYQDTLSNALFYELTKRDWKDIDDFDCSERYEILIGKSGQIIKVSMLDYQTKKDIKEYWERREYRYCIRQIYKRLRRIKFDIVRKEGTPIQERVELEIWVEKDGQIENWTN